ncbi:MAG: nucleoside triphosphate pyrophosphohydrolase [Firmicutes bacterium]|nr:nucleoside triphosphate pyrophosphohydrolase [Bacillota bacterium]
MSDEYTCEKLIEIMATLRGAQGCPWDKEQTHESLKRYLIEEAYEIIDTIDAGDPEHLKEELGDLLLQIVFHAQIAAEEKNFDMKDVLEGIITKLIRRHPHVFGEVEVTSARDVIKNWEEIKSREKEEKSVIAGIPKSLPALLYAYKLQSKAARIGFDWESVEGVLEKITEEVSELKSARQGNGKVEEEVGDLLFAIVNVARHLDVDPELALKETCSKFERRFKYMEGESRKIGKNLADMSLLEKDKLWDKAKEEGR